MKRSSTINDKKAEKTRHVASPCVSICALDENDVCIGCFRTGDEITRWGTLSVEEKRQVLLLVAEREKCHFG